MTYDFDHLDVSVAEGVEPSIGSEVARHGGSASGCGRSLDGSEVPRHGGGGRICRR